VIIKTKSDADYVSSSFKELTCNILLKPKQKQQSRKGENAFMMWM